MSMFKAIKSGDANEVMRLLNKDPSLLEGVGNPWRVIGLYYQVTPLIHAASVGQLEIVKLLTGKGADIHARSSRSETALYCAAQEGHEEVVVYLLDKGALASHQDSSGGIPVMLAARNHHTRVALLLLEHMGAHNLLGGEGLEAKCQYEGHTALHFAVRWGYMDLVAILLEYGARADTTDRYGRSAIQTAVYGGHVKIVKLLVDHLGPQALHEGDSSEEILLHSALKWHSEEMVAYLLSTGPWPTVRDKDGWTALMCGARSASIKVLQRLLEHTAGQGLNDRSSDGKTALHCAVLHNRPENVRALLQAGADPTIVDDLHRTPRMLAQQSTDCPRSAEVLKWWDGELERGSLLYRCRSLHDAYSAEQAASTRPVPGYLEARVKAGLSLPRVEVVVGHEDATGREGGIQRSRSDATEQQEGMDAMVGYVMKELSEELFTELMRAFRA